MKNNYFTSGALLKIGKRSELPTFVYSERFLKEQAARIKSVSFPFGFTPRYAMKANSHRRIIELFNEADIHFDASSSYEVSYLINECKVKPERVSLSSQQPADYTTINPKVNIIATSLHQLTLFCKAHGTRDDVGLRVNPGVGSGHNMRTTTGGVTSSFGLWHEYLKDALLLAKKHKKRITRLHIHVGSGADPKIWGEVMDSALNVVEKMPDVSILDIGGGYKIKRFVGEKEANITLILKTFAKKLVEFEKKSGRQIMLEIEPGTYFVGHAGVLVAQVVDIVDTGKRGFSFLKLNTGMNDILRPSIYGAQHEIEVLNNVKEKKAYVVVGHNCESGDILTPKKGEPEVVEPRRLNLAKIGDYIAIYDVGAYCASMSTKGYNHFPNAKEEFIK